MSTDDTGEPTDMFDVLDALEAAIRSSDPAKRAALAETIDAYAKDEPDEYFWATGAQAPTLLNRLMTVIELASSSGDGKPPVDLRLRRRKSEGSV